MSHTKPQIHVLYVVFVPPIPTQVVCPRPHSVVWATASYVRVPDLDTMPIWPGIGIQHCHHHYLLPQCHCNDGEISMWRCKIVTFHVNISGHNSDFALSWLNDSWTVWTNQSAFRLLTENILNLKFSWRKKYFVKKLCYQTESEIMCLWAS